MRFIEKHIQNNALGTVYCIGINYRIFNFVRPTDKLIKST